MTKGRKYRLSLIEKTTEAKMKIKMTADRKMSPVTKDRKYQLSLIQRMTTRVFILLPVLILKKT
jgi:hypothetical protein